MHDRLLDHAADSLAIVGSWQIDILRGRMLHVLGRGIEQVITQLEDDWRTTPRAADLTGQSRRPIADRLRRRDRQDS